MGRIKAYPASEESFWVGRLSDSPKEVVVAIFVGFCLKFEPMIIF